jgi:hypothetical protein
MIKKIICFLLGHEYKEIREFYGNLDNGKPLYKQSFGDCERCGKKK